MAKLPRSVTSIEPVARDPSLVRVAIDGADAGTVLRATAEALGLKVGSPVTNAAIVKLAEAIDVAAARTAALRLLARSDRSKAMLVAQLVARGHPERAAESATARLAEDGWLDDVRYATERARRLAARRPVAQSFVEHSLAAEGVDERIASKAARTIAPRSQDLDRAVTSAKTALGRNGAKDPKLVRRTAAALARAGFDADTIATALSRAGAPIAQDQ